MANVLSHERITEIQQVVFDLIAEHGYEAVRIDQIAKAACTSTATVYRNWGSKSGLVMSLFAAEAERGVADFPDTGSLLGDLHADVDFRAAVIPSAVRFLASIALAMRDDEELAAAYRRHALPVFRQVLDEIVARAVRRGEIAPDAPILQHLLLLQVAPWVVSDLIFAEQFDAARMHAYVDDVIAPLLAATTQPHRS